MVCSGGITIHVVFEAAEEEIPLVGFGLASEFHVLYLDSVLELNRQQLDYRAKEFNVGVMNSKQT